MSQKRLIVGLATFGAALTFAVFAPAAKASTSTIQELFNSTLTDSLITTDQNEINTLLNGSWEDGYSFTVSSSASTPVYRLYNPNSGQHYFTTNASERDSLVSLGWKYEKIAFYSGGSTPQYVYYNPANGAHFYGIQMSGTVRQGIAFYTN